MPIFAAVIEATGFVTVPDPDHPSEAVDRYLMNEEQARAYSLEALKAGTLPENVLGVFEGHVGADRDDVEGNEAKVFVSITLLMQADEEDDVADLADEPEVTALLRDVSARMGVDFDLDGFEHVSEDGLAGLPPTYDGELLALAEARIAGDAGTTAKP